MKKPAELSSKRCFLYSNFWRVRTSTMETLNHRIFCLTVNTTSKSQTSNSQRRKAPMFYIRKEHISSLLLRSSKPRTLVSNLSIFHWVLHCFLWSSESIHLVVLKSQTEHTDSLWKKILKSFGNQSESELQMSNALTKWNNWYKAY